MKAPLRIKIMKCCGRWAWCCTLCQPPAHGATDTYDRTLRSLQRHCRVRSAHHAHVAARS